jgi:cysteine desulfurase
MIYFDHAATTPVKPIALWAIEKAPYGNPNSMHKLGLEAKAALMEAEDLVKTYISGHNGRIVWLSTASLANAFVIKNAFKMPHYLPNAFICMNTAHKSIRQFGHKDTMLHPLESGLLSVRELLQKVTFTTRLVSMLYVNNETGVIQPVEIIKPKIKKALYHIDAVQAAGKLPINVEKIGCDFLTMSGHKFGTPKGIACLWIKNGVELELPYLGTPQVPMAYAFAKTLTSYNLMQRKVDIILKEQFFKKRLAEHMKLQKIKYDYNVKTIRRLPGILSIKFEDIDASELLMSLSDKELALSGGSACNSQDIVPSHVLSAMGISSKDALSTVRISLSPENTWEELEKGVKILTNTVKELYYD